MENASRGETCEKITVNFRPMLLNVIAYIELYYEVYGCRLINIRYVLVLKLAFDTYSECYLFIQYD